MDEILRPSFGAGSSPEPRCQLLGPFALIVQGGMGLLALLSLVYKRLVERPQRPIIVWLFDVSKQVLGALGIHILNLFISIVSSRRRVHPEQDDDDPHDNPCNWYFLNVLLDTTIGIPILWMFLTLLTRGAKHLRVQGIESGVYGSPPRYDYFFRQTAIYFLGLVGMKTTVYTILSLFPWLGIVTEFLLGWTYRDPRLEVAFVMLIFPLIMNMLQYVLVDNIIQAQQYKHHDYSALFRTSGDQEVNSSSSSTSPPPTTVNQNI